MTSIVYVAHKLGKLEQLSISRYNYYDLINYVTNQIR